MKGERKEGRKGVKQGRVVQGGRKGVKEGRTDGCEGRKGGRV